MRYTRLAFAEMVRYLRKGDFKSAWLYLWVTKEMWLLEKDE